ncbi:MAG: TonB family protein [Deltaproteobacteria bacterium]|nr:TonB family protein [Deltaproteobacteria bacterium]
MARFPTDDSMLAGDALDVTAGMPPRVITAWRVAAAASVVAHLFVGAFAIRSIEAAGGSGGDGALDVGRVYPLPDSDAPIVVELPAMSAVDLPESTIAQVGPAAPVSAGGAKVAHVDAEKAGHGGDATVEAKARNLAPRPEERTTIDTMRDAISDEQENRLLTGKKRASRVDLRLALQPMELTFVASGKGFRYERRPVAASDASLGVAGGKGLPVGANAVGQGAPLAGDGATIKVAGGPTLGGATASSKGGAAYGSAWVGVPQEVGAKVATGRPHVDKGKPSVTANVKGQPADDVDADQAVAVALKSVVANSTAGGAALGDGKGGSGGGGDPGSGGKSGSGLSSAALGAGPGSADGPVAIERTEWFRNLQKRLGSVLRDTFPKERELELRNGTVIVDVVIAKGGGVVDAVVVRDSGFPDFDQNVVTRLRGAGTLEPVPDVLSKGTITVRIPVTGGWRLQ